MAYRLGNLIITNPELLAAILPLLMVFYFLIFKKLFKDTTEIEKRRPLRRITAVFTTLTIILLVISLAGVIIEVPREGLSSESVIVLKDNTSSMIVYDSTMIQGLISSLSDDTVVDEEMINTGMASPLGEAILKTSVPGRPILVISDFRSNSGIDAKDAAILAANSGTRIFGLDLKPDSDEFGVRIHGPDKVLSGVETNFEIEVFGAGKATADVIVELDGNEIMDKRSGIGSFDVNLSLSGKEHKLIARVDAQDNYPENDIYYKTIRVVDKPKIILVTEGIPEMAKAFDELYDIDIATSVPDDLSPYYAAVLYDLPADRLEKDDVDRLTRFLSEGNGVFFIGGKDSFEYGGYDSSEVSDILPVGIGKPKKKKDSVNIVIGIDTGVSGIGVINTTGSSGDVMFIDVQKALAADVIQTIAGSSKVAVIESNVFAKIVSKLSQLEPKRDQLIDLVKRIKLHDATRISDSVLMARNLLKLERGSKNIIFITDGNVGKYDQEMTIKNVRAAHDDGITTFIIGVGQDADVGFLQQVAAAGGGRYFHTDQSNRLNIFFGEGIPQEDKTTLFIYDTNHFITSSSDYEYRILGFNSVYPKANSRMLATTSGGDPLLVVSRFGLGRIAALATDPDVWAPELIEKQDSELLVRTLNWLIEDPERKLGMSIEFPEFREGEPGKIIITSAYYPSSLGLDLIEEEEGVYSAYYSPDSAGFFELANITAAANYNRELSAFGLSDDAEDIVEITGGKILKQDAGEILEEVESFYEESSTKVIDVSWMFIAAGIAVYLVGVAVRKMSEVKISRKGG